MLTSAPGGILELLESFPTPASCHDAADVTCFRGRTGAVTATV